MQKSLCRLLLAACCYSPVSAQLLERPLGPVYAGLCAYSRIQADPFSFPANQALLGIVKKAFAGVYGEQKYLLPEAGCYLAAAAQPVQKGAIGAKLAYAGTGAYRETQGGIAYGRRLGQKLAIGAGSSYNSQYVASYGKISSLSLEAGAIYYLSSQLTAGAQVRHTARLNAGSRKGDKKRPSIAAGAGYEVSGQFLAGICLEKDEGRPVNIQAGISYMPVPYVRVRMGISSSAASPWMSVGFSRSSFRLEASGHFHNQLGWTPGLSFICTARPEKEGKL